MRPALLAAALLTSAACTTVAPSSAPAPARLAAAPTTAVAASTVSSSSTTPPTTAPTTALTTTAAPTTAAPTTAAPATSATTTVPVARVVTMAFSGDTLPHSPLWREAARTAEAQGLAGFDFRPMLAGLEPVVGAVDLAVCHLETPIAPAGEEYSTMPYYGVPAEIADAIAAAGYDRCSTASNHTADRGVVGIARTVAVLEAAGLGQSGMARTPAEIRPRVFEVGGVAICHLSYTWSYNGLSLPPGEEWRSALIDPFRIVADARRARAIGAEVVIVSLHWGAEGQHEPTRYQREIAEGITASGAIDLVVGHHAHVLQPIERVNGTWVLYGLGNILSNLPVSDRWPAATQDAAVVTVRLRVRPDGAVTVGRPVVHPTWVDKDDGWQVVLVQDELARPDISDGRRSRLEASLARTTAVLGKFLPAA